MKKFRSFLRTVFTFFRLWQLVTFFRRSKPVRLFLWKRYIRKIYINKEGKIALPNIEYYLTHFCNLKCEHCAAYTPFQYGDTPRQELLESFESWSKRLSPKKVSLLGGEPFLHPDCEDIIFTASAAWKPAEISVITNGILLPKMSDLFLKKLSDHHIRLIISKHIDTDNYNNSIKKTIQRLNSFNVCYEIIHSYRSWVTCQTFDSDGIPVPANSDPRASWSACCSKTCVTIDGSKLFHCSPLFCLQRAVLKKNLPVKEWEKILKHRPALINDVTEDILSYLHRGVMNECSVCPSHFTPVEARQIPSERLRLSKQKIAERNYADLQN